MKVKLLQTIQHPKGDVVKGTICDFDKDKNLHVIKNKEGIIIFSVSELSAKAMPQLFELIK